MNQKIKNEIKAYSVRIIFLLISMIYYVIFIKSSFDMPTHLNNVLVLSILAFWLFVKWEIIAKFTSLPESWST